MVVTSAKAVARKQGDMEEFGGVESAASTIGLKKGGQGKGRGSKTTPRSLA